MLLLLLSILIFSIYKSLEFLRNNNNNVIKALSFLSSFYNYLRSRLSQEGNDSLAMRAECSVEIRETRRNDDGDGTIQSDTNWRNALRETREEGTEGGRRGGGGGRERLNCRQTVFTIVACNTRVTLYSPANFPNDLAVLLVFYLNTTKLGDKPKPVKPKRFLPRVVLAHPLPPTPIAHLVGVVLILGKRVTRNENEWTRGTFLRATGNSLDERDEKGARRRRRRKQSENKQRDTGRIVGKLSGLSGRWSNSVSASLQVYNSKRFRFRVSWPRIGQHSFGARRAARRVALSRDNDAINRLWKRSYFEAARPRGSAAYEILAHEVSEAFRDNVCAVAARDATRRLPGECSRRPR